MTLFGKLEIYQLSLLILKLLFYSVLKWWQQNSCYCFIKLVYFYDSCSIVYELHLANWSRFSYNYCCYNILDLGKKILLYRSRISSSFERRRTLPNVHGLKRSRERPFKFNFSQECSFLFNSIQERSFTWMFLNVNERKQTFIWTILSLNVFVNERSWIKLNAIERSHEHFAERSDTSKNVQERLWTFKKVRCARAV